MRKLIIISVLFFGFLFAEGEPIIKDIPDFEILGHTANKVVCKFIIGNDLTVDLIYSDVDTTYLVYPDKAYNLNDIPFELTEDEISELTQ